MVERTVYTKQVLTVPFPVEFISYISKKVRNDALDCGENRNSNYEFRIQSKNGVTFDADMSEGDVDYEYVDNTILKKQTCLMRNIIFVMQDRMCPNLTNQ